MHLKPLMKFARAGFTLVELSIVLVILGIVLAGGLSVGTSVVERQAIIETNNQMDELIKALKSFYSINGRLPCPANPATATGAGPGGEEACTPDSGTVNGVIQVGAGATRIRIGAVPTRALGLRDRFIADEYGNRYIYAVTSLLTNSGSFAGSNGAITIVDGTSAAGTPIVTDAAYALVSTGPNGRGARRYQSGAAGPVACGAITAGNPLDNHNCNNDATFRDARYNNGSVVASFFDDFIRWQQKALLASGSGSGGGGGGNMWSAVTATPDDIYLVGGNGVADTGRVGIGTTTPARLLDVSVTTALDAVRFTDNTRMIQFSPGNVAAGNWNPLTQNNDNIIMFNGGAINTGALTIAQWSNSGPPYRGIRIASDGKVGIGTAAPTEVLDVNGYVYALDYLIPSDKRLKHDIAPLFDGKALDAIDKIRAVSFKWNDTNKPDIGVVAQEVEKVFPQAVRTGENGFKRVAYDKLVLPLIEAVKELHQLVIGALQRMDTIEAKQSEADAKIAALAKENAALKSRLEALEEKIYKDNAKDVDPKRELPTAPLPHRGE